MSKLLRLVPCLYMLLTRVRTLRDVTYLIATSWIPAWWLVFRLTDLGPTGAALAFGQGFLAFVAIYEIGYLVNDVWDAGRDESGRKRIGFHVSFGFAATFVAIRVAVWGGIAISTAWFGNLAWIAGFIALIVMFTQHNFTKAPSLRIASFLGLATLRFILPIIAVLPAREYPIAIVSALLLYSHLRLLSYMDSKGLLNMPERRISQFGAHQMFMLTPLIIAIAVICQWQVLFELHVLLVLIHTAYPILYRVELLVRSTDRNHIAPKT